MVRRTNQNGVLREEEPNPMGQKLTTIKSRIVVPAKTILVATFVMFLSGNSFARDSCIIDDSRGHVINVNEFGATGDGLKDDTEALQSAIDQASIVRGIVFIPDGIYLVNATKGLDLKSGVFFKMTKNAVLKAIPNKSDGYAILRVRNASDIVILGGTLLGERYEHLGKTGEWGMGLFLDAASNIVIKNVTSKNNWGDGFYIGGNSKGVSLCTVVADGNRRQGMSIVFASNVVVKDSTFSNSKGTSPEAGLDIEPNDGQSVENVIISDSNFFGNSGPGILLYAPPKSSDSSISNIEIRNNSVSGNRKDGISVHYAREFFIFDNIVSSNHNNPIYMNDGTWRGVVVGNKVVSNKGANSLIIDKASNFVSRNYRLN